MIGDLRRLLMWHQKAKGPPDGPPIFLIFVEKLNCPQSQAYQSISPVGTGLSLTDRALGVSLGTSIGNYSPLIAPQPVKLKIHRWRHRAGSSPATGTSPSVLMNTRTFYFAKCRYEHSHQTESGRNTRSRLSFSFILLPRLWQTIFKQIYSKFIVMGVSPMTKIKKRSMCGKIGIL